MTAAARSPGTHDRTVSADVVLAAVAVLLLGLFLTVAVVMEEFREAAPSWLADFANDHTGLIVYGLPSGALVLIGLSLVVRSRRR